MLVGIPLCAHCDMGVSRPHNFLTFLRFAMSNGIYFDDPTCLAPAASSSAGSLTLGLGGAEQPARPCRRRRSPSPAESCLSHIETLFRGHCSKKRRYTPSICIDYAFTAATTLLSPSLRSNDGSSSRRRTDIIVDGPFFRRR